MASSSGGSTSSRHRHQYRLLANVTGQRSLGASCIRRIRVVAAGRPASFASGCLTMVRCAVQTRSLHYINYCWQRVFLPQPSVIISIPGQRVCLHYFWLFSTEVCISFNTLSSIFYPFPSSLFCYPLRERVEHLPVLPFSLYPVLL